MLIKEYRIPLPMTVEEYRIAQLYMIAKKSREESKVSFNLEIYTVPSIIVNSKHSKSLGFKLNFYWFFNREQSLALKF